MTSKLSLPSLSVRPSPGSQATTTMSRSKRRSGRFCNSSKYSIRKHCHLSSWKLSASRYNHWHLLPLQLLPSPKRIQLDTLQPPTPHRPPPLDILHSRRYPTTHRISLPLVVPLAVLHPMLRNFSPTSGHRSTTPLSPSRRRLHLPSLTWRNYSGVSQRLNNHPQFRPRRLSSRRRSLFHRLCLRQ
jgi:hypothetical protein